MSEHDKTFGEWLLNWTITGGVQSGGNSSHATNYWLTRGMPVQHGQSIEDVDAMLQAGVSDSDYSRVRSYETVPASPLPTRDAVAKYAKAREAFLRQRSTEARDIATLQRRIAGRKKSAGSVVYFMRAGLTGPIKIGTTTDVDGRVSSLRTGSSEAIHVLATVPGDRSLEKHLHERFADLRMEGEWFRPSETLLAFIDGVNLGRGE